MIALKREGNACLQPPNDLQKYAPVWPQLHLQGSRLVRHLPAYSDPASQVQVVVPKSLVPSFRPVAQFSYWESSRSAEITSEI